VDLADTVDVVAERARLTKDHAAAVKEREQAMVKLENPEFMAKAPDAVVAKIKERLSSAESEMARIEGLLSSMAQD
jgi:valyl-tRNA synthetase